ncbi:MAG: ABC transporter substrate-binding protein, partial [Pseudomonadota bacterium]
MKTLILAGASALALGTSAFADVKIGNPMAVTGPIPDLVAPMVEAVNLAATHVNEQGGVLGEPYVVVSADSACDPAAAVDAVTKLINVDQVSAILGPVCSGATIAQATSVSVPAGVVTLSVSASSPDITSLDDNDLVFRTAASDAYQGVALAELAMSKGYDTLAVSYAQDDYNAAIARVFSAAFEEMGGTITANEAHEPGKASYAGEVATLGRRADTLALFAYYGSSGVTIMRNALEAGAFENFIGADGMLSQDTIDQLGAENLTTATFTTSASDPERAGFAAWKALADAAGVPASDPFVANAYDASFMMALAIEAAGSADRAGLAAALRSIAGPEGETILPGEFAKAREILAGGGTINYDGAAGPQDFDAAGDVAGFFSSNVVVDGAWEATLIK